MTDEIHVADIMTRDVVSCSPDTPLAEICDLMKHRHFTSLLVLQDGACVGIVTLGDLANAFANSLDVRNTCAASIMSSPVEFILESTALSEAMTKMHTSHLKRMAVKDEQGNLNGIVTQTDLISAALDSINHYAGDLEGEVKNRTKELEELSKLKNEFLGTVAHDLRNPLAIIQMWTELLEAQLGEKVPNELQEGFSTIMAQSVHMLTLIDDLLDVSKIESSSVSFNMAPVQLSEFMDEVLHLQERIAARKGIVLHNDLAPDLPLVVADRSRLRSVLENLISNAIKYSNNGDSVHVKAFGYDGVLQVDIEDTGQGIHEEEVEKLFAEFSTASSTPTGGEAKTGLGLAIVKKIIQHHGGKVWVKSVLNQGSIFSFTLPIVSNQ